jgi:hypothetical protein
MGISIEVDAIVPVDSPERLVMTLECEDTSDIFCRGFEKFSHADGYIAMHRQAMDAGWLERQTDQGRAWVCPRCSGK